MRDARGPSRCEVTLREPAPAPLVARLHDHFADVIDEPMSVTVTVLGVDQSAVRALLVLLWDAGCEVCALVWHPGHGG
jgi:hypothetical protein